MKSISIQLFGGPGSGKSTTAADLFALLKRTQYNAELVREYVKDWVWEERKILPTDQIYLLAKQARREQILYKKVDVVISDSPIWQFPVYEKKFSTGPYVCQQIIDKFVSEAVTHGVEHKHVFLNRVKAYNPKGRFQNETEAKEIDREIKEYLTSQNISFMEVDGDDFAAKKILTNLGLSR